MEVLSTEEASLELNDKVLFEGLQRLAVLYTPPGNTQSVGKERTRRELYSNKHIPEIHSPAFLASGLVRDGNLPDVWWSGQWNSFALILQRVI